MKSILFVLMFAFVAALNSKSQVSWKVYHNKQEIFSAEAYNEKQNIASIPRGLLDSQGELVVVFIEKEPLPEWERKMLLVGANDKVLIEKPGSARLAITNEELKKLFAENGTLRIFTINLPTDPAVAASVRVARRHLCTLELK